MKGNNKEKNKTKVKLKYKNILLFLVIFLIAIFVITKLLHANITNIYISGNNVLSDWEIIKLASLSDYPNTLKHPSFIIKNRLEKNDMIIKANVSKESLTKIYINIEENRPLFYNSNINKMVMLDKKTLEIEGNVPYLINYIPDTVYNKFIDAISLVNQDVLARISEIEYKSNDVDQERFYLTMNDGNYVYINIRNFEKINNYINMLKKINGKKGILYLDSGEYFEIK